MALELTLQTQQKPTIFNKDMVVGLLIGLLVLPVPSLALGAIAAPLIGGLIGRRRIARENAQGREVSPPSVWNKDTFIGLLAGHHIGTLVGVALGVSVGIGGAMFGDFSAGEALLASGASAVMGWAASVGMGMLLGAKSGKQRMSMEYAEAQRQQEVLERSRMPAREMQRSIEPDLAPERKFAPRLEEQMLATAQQNIDNAQRGR